MTRLAGLVSLSLGELHVDRQVLDRMSELQAHRGFSKSRIGNLGPVQIAVTSFSDAELERPESHWADDAERQIWLYIDGTIFNRNDLAHLLDIATHGAARVPTAADVALAAYTTWGVACFGRFRGSFAIAVFDRGRGLVLLARDQLGTKPLNYTLWGGHLAFASEFKPLLSLQGNTRLNQRALLEFCLHSDVLPPETLFEGVFSIPPGHMLVVDGETRAPVLKRYHNGADEVDEKLYREFATSSPEHFLAALDQQLRQSVHECMEGLSPVGVAFSGGVDSSIITSIACRDAGITTLHVSVPDDRRMDERSIAERIARNLGVAIEVLPMNGESYRGELVAATYANEMPMWHMQCVGFHAIARKARDLGIRCLLSGDTLGPLLGAEKGRHLFWRRFDPLLRASAAVPVKITQFQQKASYAFAGLPVSSTGFTLHAPLAMQLIDGFARTSLIEAGEEAYRFVKNSAHRKIHGVKLADLSFAFNRFFHRGDRLAMVSGVENRNPFGDTAALRLSLNMPLSLNVRGGEAKWSLKELASRYLPREIAFRKKVAWDFPADVYLCDLAAPQFFGDGFCSQTFALSRESIDRQLDAWRSSVNSLSRMVHIEVWGRLFFMNQSVDQIAALIEACTRRSGVGSTRGTGAKV